LVIGLALVQIVPRCFAAWDDGLQKTTFSGFNERHEIRISFELDNEDPLMGVPNLVWVFQHVEQVAIFDGLDDVLERDPPFDLESLVLRLTSAKQLVARSV